MAQTASIAMVGLSGLNAANQIGAANARKKLGRAQTRLELAKTKREEEEKLARGLARQQVVAGARGVSASSGSLMRQALAADRAARRRIGLAAGSASLSNASEAIRARHRRNAALISFGQSFARRAPTIFDE